MRISFNWLRELVDLPKGVAVEDVANRLTLAGLEVEGIDRRGRELRGVLVAEVRAVRPHPQAEKLTLVRVHAGAEEKEVVCGAPNVPAPGGRVCWAPPGATLPGGRTLERREIRGAVSPGMLCSEIEMGLGEEGDGILILSPSAPPGADVAAHLGVLDDVMEVSVGANRPDALSHAGIAREVAAQYCVGRKLPAPDDVPVAGDAPVPEIVIRDQVACPRYLARIVTGLSVGPSPAALRVRLQACGVRTISNLVDATNYVLLETGHPLHAFDLGRIEGGIFVRRAAPRERMTTLDGQDRELAADDIVIADARAPVALAGVMGGATSEVSRTTTAVLLEAATFDPRSVRRTAKRLGLHSEASHRFERGVDPEGIPHAAARAAAMMARLGGGAVAPQAVDRYPAPPRPRRVTVSLARVSALAGYAVAPDEATRTLRSIGLPAEVSLDGVTVEVPSFRPDIVIEEDVVEEVLRLSGLDRVPARLPMSRTAPGRSPEAISDRARDLCAAAGLHEVVTWAFVQRKALAAIGGEREDIPLSQGIKVKNPISADYEVLRTSLLPGLADAARRNLARGVPDPRVFEVGPVVRRSERPDGEPDEPTFAAGLMCGRHRGWMKQGPLLDFFDAKRVVGELLAGLGIRHPAYRAAAAGLFLHPGVSADILVADGDRLARVGCLGELHPIAAKALGLDPRDTALYFEVSLSALPASSRTVRVVPPPRFPSVTRDVSYWIDAAVPAGDQRAAFRGAGEPLLREIAVLEDFRDPAFAPAGKKGMLWSMTYRADDRTLTDVEAAAAHSKVVAAVKRKFAIAIR